MIAWLNENKQKLDIGHTMLCTCKAMRIADINGPFKEHVWHFVQKMAHAHISAILLC